MTMALAFFERLLLAVGEASPSSASPSLTETAGVRFRCGAQEKRK
jgi:hypothetical protein